MRFTRIVACFVVWALTELYLLMGASSLIHIAADRWGHGTMQTALVAAVGGLLGASLGVLLVLRMLAEWDGWRKEKREKMLAGQEAQ